MLITIDIRSSQEAENLLFSLVLRSKQKNLSKHHVDEAIDVANRLDKVFTTQFGWDVWPNRIKNMRHPIKYVTIKGYDLPPKD